jgi:hypothetical protein
MTAFDTYFPLDTGLGANSGQARWRKMARVWCDGGVARDVGGTDGTTSGKEFGWRGWWNNQPGHCLIDAGGAWVNGFYGELGVNPYNWIGLDTPGDHGIIKARLDPVNSQVQILFEAWYGLHEDPDGYFEVPLWELQGFGNVIDRRRIVPIEQEFGLADIPPWVPRGARAEFVGPAAQVDLAEGQGVFSIFLSWAPGFVPGRDYRITGYGFPTAVGGVGQYGFDLVAFRASDSVELARRSVTFDMHQVAGAGAPGWADWVISQAPDCQVHIITHTQNAGVILRWPVNSCVIEVEDYGQP